MPNIRKTRETIEILLDDDRFTLNISATVVAKLCIGTQSKVGENALVLLMYYKTQAAYQNTSKTWTTDKFAMSKSRGLGWSKDKFYAAKRLLQDLGLIKIVYPDDWQPGDKVYLRIHSMSTSCVVPENRTTIENEAGPRSTANDPENEAGPSKTQDDPLSLFSGCPENRTHMLLRDLKKDFLLEVIKTQKPRAQSALCASQMTEEQKTASLALFDAWVAHRWKKQRGLSDARKVWLRINPTELQAVWLAHHIEWLNRTEYALTEARYIPRLVDYLRGEIWTDPDGEQWIDEIRRRWLAEDEQLNAHFEHKFQIKSRHHNQAIHKAAYDAAANEIAQLTDEQVLSQCGDISIPNFIQGKKRMDFIRGFLTDLRTTELLEQPEDAGTNALMAADA